MKTKSTLGWKSVDREVACDVLIDEAVERLLSHEFEVSNQLPGLTILRRPGSWWKAEFVSIFKPNSLLEGIPLEVAISEAETGLFLQVRYDAFVVFDTGDLEKLADKLAVIIQTPKHA